MKNYTYQNTLIGKKQLRQLLAWSFTNYDSMQACALADELKYLGFKYASQAGISISIEDLKIPFVKNLMLEKAKQDLLGSENNLRLANQKAADVTIKRLTRDNPTMTTMFRELEGGANEL